MTLHMQTPALADSTGVVRETDLAWQRVKREYTKPSRRAQSNRKRREPDFARDITHSVFQDARHKRSRL